MRAYYDARAGEYDDWWLGRGLYAELDRPGWHEEVERVCEVVARAWRHVACSTSPAAPAI